MVKIKEVPFNSEYRCDCCNRDMKEIRLDPIPKIYQISSNNGYVLICEKCVDTVKNIFDNIRKTKIKNIEIGNILEE